MKAHLYVAARWYEARSNRARLKADRLKKVAEKIFRRIRGDAT